ncbi:MAG: glucokinase [Kofleriaceae bacterium]
MILAGDVGGTKTLLAMFEPGGAGAPGLTPRHEESFACADFASLAEVIARFLATRALAPSSIRAACFGVAGPVDAGVARITNLPWVIDAASLSAQLAGAPVSLLNDLQATALGALALPPASFAILQPGTSQPPAGATVAVVAPGTGLGESLLVSLDGAYHALPSEAGHADLAPTTEEHLAIWRFLRRRHGDHVSVERALCGDGLGDLHDYVRELDGAAEPPWLREARDRNAAISEAALRDADAACARALELFVELLGAEAGNLALRGLARGGVILGGGIPPKILPALQRPRFLAAFRAKGRFTDWLAGLEVKVALEPRAALLGAARQAAARAR